MMDRLKKAASSTKNFVQRHQVAVTAVVTTTVTTTALVALQVRNARILNDFLEEKDLYDEYYHMDEV